MAFTEADYQANIANIRQMLAEQHQAELARLQQGHEQAEAALKEQLAEVERQRDEHVQQLAEAAALADAWAAQIKEYEDAAGGSAAIRAILAKRRRIALLAEKRRIEQELAQE